MSLVGATALNQAANSASGAITPHASTASGHGMYVVVVTNGAPITIVENTAGGNVFQKVLNADVGSYESMALFYKVAGTLESTKTYSFTQDGATSRSWQIICVTDTLPGIDAYDWTNDGGNLAVSTVPAPSLTPSETAMLYTFHSINAGTTTATWTADPAGMDAKVIESQQTGGGKRPLVAYRDTTTAAVATGIQTATSSATAAHIGLSITLKATAGVASLVTVAWPGATTSTGFTVKGHHQDVVNGTRLKVSTSADLSSPTYFPASPVVPASHGWVTQAATGLSANTQYYYGWEQNGAPTAGGTGACKTFVTNGTATSFSFSGGSCGDPDGIDDTVNYATMQAHDDLFTLFDGDFFYELNINQGSTDPAVWRSQWIEPIRDQPMRKALVQSRTNVFSRGDHDSVGNDCDRHWTGWSATNTAFQDIVPHYTLKDSGGVEQEFQVGRVRFYILECYAFRDEITVGQPNYVADTLDGSSLPNRTMLGTAQRNRFKTWLTTYPADMKIVISAVGWHSIDYGAGDWSDFQMEQNNILAAATAANVRNTLIICGDMHALAWDSGNNTPGGWPVCHAAPLNQEPSSKGGTYDKPEYPPKPMAQYEGIYYSQHGRWVVDDSGGNDITISFTGHDSVGNVVLAESVMLFEDVGAAVAQENILPTATRNVTNLTPSDNTSAILLLDEDIDTNPTPDYLTGSDPSGTPASVTNQYAASQVAAVGVALQLTNPANAVGSGEGTLATVVSGTQNSSYANFFTFGSAFSSIPSDATISSVLVELRQWASAANRITAFARMDSANGTQIGATENSSVVSTTTPAATTANAADRFSSWATLPTVAQLQAATFGVRVRQVRTVSTAADYNLDWVRVTVNYQTAGSTVNTKVEAIMGNPTGTLKGGPNTGEVKIRVRKKGTGTDPVVRAEIHEAATGAVVATPIADTAVSGVLNKSGKFDQHAINNKNDVEIWVIGTGAAGGLVEIDGCKWIANTRTESVRTRLSPGAIVSQTNSSETLTNYQRDPDQVT